MLKLLRGDVDFVHGPDEAVTYEMAGSAAVFRGDYKLMRNNPPFGDRQWRLYHAKEDPVEVHDLAKAKPELVAELIAEYDRFRRKIQSHRGPRRLQPHSPDTKECGTEPGQGGKPKKCQPSIDEARPDDRSTGTRRGVMAKEI